MSILNEAKEKPTPNPLQTLEGEQLRSQQRIQQTFPRILSHKDLLALFIIVVLFIPNVSIVQAAQGAGPTIYLYWIIGAITFLIPGAVASKQLNTFLPVDGSIYLWTQRALGPILGFFAGFCAWFPGILVLLAAADGVLTLLQGMSIQLQNSNKGMVNQPWEQGLVVLGVLLIASWIATWSLPVLMKGVKILVICYGIAIGIVGLAGIIWLMSGHMPQIPQTTTHLFELNQRNIALYGVIVLSLLGVEVPLNMSAETVNLNSAKTFLRWGPLLVLIGYLIGTFGVMVVVPPNIAGASYSTITAVYTVFGTPVALLVTAIFIAFFITVIVVYHIAFARILVVSALEERISSALSKLNRYGAPAPAIIIQSIIAIVIIFFTYFLGPLLYPSDGLAFSSRVYTIMQATTSVIWCISMVILFLDLPILLKRTPSSHESQPRKLIAPIWVLYLCSAVGGIASILGIWITLWFSWDTHLVSNDQWTLLVGASTLGFLIIGLIGASYPHLLSSLEKQTATAKENERLYNELRLASVQPSELDRLKETLLVSINHELRTPLTIVHGYLELLHNMEDVSPDMRQTFVREALQACGELMSLQANILDASRVEFDTAALHCTAIPLKETTRDIIDLFNPLFQKEERQIEVDIADGIRVLADKIALKQILHHLLTNALRYSPPQTPIYLDAIIEREQRMVRIRVTDHGAGVPLDKQAAIFDKFVRLERDMYSTIRGSGLGLFITRQLVEAMQGRIMVESSGIPNKGSTFSFTLPLAERACNEQRAERATSSDDV